MLSLPSSLSPWQLLQQSPCSQESCLLGRGSGLLGLFIVGKQQLGDGAGMADPASVWVIHGVCS